MNEIVIIICFLLAWMCNGLMDRIQFHWETSPQWMQRRFQFWNPKESWTNKWKKDDSGFIIINENQKNVERFPFSSTLLVPLTDGWHLLKEIKIELLCVGFAIALGAWYYWLIFRIVMIIGFKITYR